MNKRIRKKKEKQRKEKEKALFFDRLWTNVALSVVRSFVQICSQPPVIKKENESKNIEDETIIFPNNTVEQIAKEKRDFLIKNVAISEESKKELYKWIKTNDRKRTKRTMGRNK